MKKVVWIAALILVFPAGTAMGDVGNGIDLTWDDCVGGASAQNNKDFTPCTGDKVHELIGCFKVATDMPDFFAMDVSIDLQQADGNPLVPFYHYEGCNRYGLGQNDARTQAGPSCLSFTTPWPTVGISPPVEPPLAYGPNFMGRNGRGRLLTGFYRPSDNPFPLVAGTNYYGFHLEFYDHNASEAGGACSGCGTPASVVWNSATLFGDTETRLLTGADKKAFYCATINQGASSCAATPTRNTTWGQLKSIYR